jgi:hypothetical protein
MLAPAATDTRAPEIMPLAEPLGRRPFADGRRSERVKRGPGRLRAVAILRDSSRCFIRAGAHPRPPPTPLSPARSLFARSAVAGATPLEHGK